MGICGIDKNITLCGDDAAECWECAGERGAGETVSGETGGCTGGEEQDGVGSRAVQELLHLGRCLSKIG